MRNQATHNCPRCKAETIWQGNPDRPFCSEKCRLIDLGKWAEEEYRIESAERPLAEENVVPLHPDDLEE